MPENRAVSASAAATSAYVPYATTIRMSGDKFRNVCVAQPVLSSQGRAVLDSPRLTPTERFSNRVDDYVRSRPGYPPEVLDCLRHNCGLTPASVIADVGSGTGKLTEILVRNGNRVFAVEPNAAMRAAGEQLLQEYAN